MKLEVKVKKIGTAVGTSGWLKKEFDDAYLELSKTRLGLPCIVLKKRSEPNKVGEVIAFVGGEFEDGYVNHGDNIWALHVEEKQYVSGFVSYATPCTYKILDKFIDDAVDILKNYLNEDKADFKIELIKK